MLTKRVNIMQYCQYEHADGTPDCGPYLPRSNYTIICYTADSADYQIMKLRTKAGLRGASPIEIQINVNKLGGIK